MKKMCALLIIMSFFWANFVFAFEDEFVNSILDKNLKIKKQDTFLFEDELVKSTLSNNLKIKKQPINNIVDDTLPVVIQPANYNKGNLNFDFEKLDNAIIKIHTLRNYSTRKSLVVGQYIDFYLKEDLEYNNVVYKKGTLVKARVENITQNGAYGVPADFVIDNFVLVTNNNKNIPLNGSISKTGANRAIWVYPVSIVFLPFFGLGLFVLPIRGGHAKLNKTKVYELELN